ncbi:MAG TPA: HlyD family efflux transporter periplasmic adaptor subunit [Bacillota bacterium]
MALQNETHRLSGGSPKHHRFKIYFSVLFRILLFIVIIEAGWLLVRNLNLRPVVAKWGVIEKGYWTEALFLREETSIIAPISGIFETEITSGIRVPEGEFLAYLHPETEQVTREEALQQYKLQARWQELTTEIKGQTMELNRIETALRRSKTASASRLGTVREQQILNEESAHVRTYLAENQAEIKKLSVELSRNLLDQPVIFSAPVPGYCFFLHDGWEGKLSPERILQLMPDDFKRNYRVRLTKTKVTAGDTVAKIINPFRQVVIIQPDTRRTGIPQIGQSWWIKNAAGLNKVIINRVWTLPSGNAKSDLVVALDDSQLDRSLLPDRRLRVFLVYRRVTGIVIPKRAVIKNGQTIVRVMKGDGYTKQPVKILESDDSNVIVSGLDFGTTIISR